MRTVFTADEITSAIRRGPNCYAAKGAYGIWGFYAISQLCFIKEKAETPILMRWCDDGENERLDIMERLGIIVCISISTPDGVYAITKKLVS